MIKSFENLEDKFVDNYIKKSYKNNDINEDDDNSLKNYVKIAKKLENSMINFNKDEIRNYIDEYNKNLKEINYYRVLLNKNFYDFDLNIINNLINYLNNLINETH